MPASAGIRPGTYNIKIHLIQYVSIHSMYVLLFSFTFLSWYHLVLSVTGFSRQKHRFPLGREVRFVCVCVFCKGTCYPIIQKYLQCLRNPSKIVIFIHYFGNQLFPEILWRLCPRNRHSYTLDLKYVPDSFRARYKWIAWTCEKLALNSALTFGSAHFGNRTTTKAMLRHNSHLSIDL